MAIKLKQNNANIELKNLGQTIKGEDGGYYIPSVDESGELSWTTSKSGMTSVASANIKGPRGEQGEPGKDGSVSFDSLTDAQKAQLKGEKGDAGAPGKDGLTISITMNGTTHTQVDGNIDLGTVITEHQDVNGKEDETNKVTSISANSTDTQYPSAKCVYNLVGNVETILNTLNSGGGAS